MSQLLYIADDEKNVLDMLSSFMEREGYDVRTFSDGESLLAACEETMPDLVVLDIIMPGMDGLSVSTALRQKNKKLPIIIISVKGSSFDRVTGLTLGCDDYIIKPFLPLELSIRARTLLQRGRTGTESECTESALNISFGPLVLNPGQHTATLDGAPFALSPTEFSFLIYLIERQGSAVSRKELLGTLWQVKWDVNTRAADDLVKRLRRKFRKKNSPIRIETVWGYGFRIALAGESS